MVSTVPVMIPLTVRRRLQPRPRALAQWNKALETSPKSAAAHYNLFDLYSTKLMYDNAVAQLEQALGKSTRGECCGCQLQACWVPGSIAGKMDSNPSAMGLLYSEPSGQGARFTSCTRSHPRRLMPSRDAVESSLLPWLQPGTRRRSQSQIDPRLAAYVR